MSSTSEDIFQRLETAIAEWSAEVRSSTAGISEQLARARGRLGEAPEESTALEPIAASLNFAQAEFARLETALRACHDAARQASGRTDSVEAALEGLRNELAAHRHETMQAVNDLASRPVSDPERGDALSAEIISVKEELARVREQAAQSGEVQDAEAQAAMYAEITDVRAQLAELRTSFETMPVQEDAGAALQPEMAALRNELASLREGLAEASETANRIDELEGLIAVERERADRLERALAEGRPAGADSETPPELVTGLEDLRHAQNQLHAEIEQLKTAFAQHREALASGHGHGSVAYPSDVKLDLMGFDGDGRRRRMGDILRDAGVLTEEQLERALEMQRAEPQRRLGSILVELGFTESEVIAQVLACQLKLPFVHLDQDVPQEEAVRLVNGRLAAHHRCIPLRLEEDTVVLAMANPLDLIAIEDIELATGRRVDPVVAGESDISKAVEWYYGSEH